MLRLQSRPHRAGESEDAPLACTIVCSRMSCLLDSLGGHREKVAAWLSWYGRHLFGVFTARVAMAVVSQSTFYEFFFACLNGVQSVGRGVKAQ